jgi:hypothetical protein
LIEEVQAMPPFKPVVEQPYSAVLRRVGTGLAFQKIIVPEVIAAGLPEKRAAAVWKFWAGLGPGSRW